MHWLRSSAAVCPSNFELKDGKAKPKKTEVSQIGCCQEAADTCPVKCIHIQKR